MLKLGVNIDHTATLREARYKNRGFGEPDPIEIALLCEQAGAHGITAHLREDRRHIQDERRQEVTTEGGLDVKGQEKELTPTVKQLRQAGIIVSLFIAPEPEQIEASARIGAEFIELHTGAFAETRDNPAEMEAELQRLIEAASLAHKLGLKVNAGHGINYTNIKQIYRVPHLVELNIGHSIISRAVNIGIKCAVREMLELIKHYPFKE